jgi:hypothetical protein
MVPHFLQDSIVPKDGIQKNQAPVSIKITNQAVSKVNHFSKTTDTKKVQCHLQNHFLSMVEEMEDVIFPQVPLTHMIIMSSSLITNTGKVIVVLDLVTGVQEVWVCKIKVIIEAHISTEVIIMIEASITNTAVSVIPTVDSSTNIVDSHRMVDKAKEGVCNFI